MTPREMAALPIEKCSSELPYLVVALVLSHLAGFISVPALPRASGPAPFFLLPFRSAHARFFLSRDTHKSSTAVGWLFSLHVTYLGEKHNFVFFCLFPRWVAVDLSVFCRVRLEVCLKVWLMSGMNATRLRLSQL